jgi:hypothetical protein
MLFTEKKYVHQSCKSQTVQDAPRRSTKKMTARPYPAPPPLAYRLLGGSALDVSSSQVHPTLSLSPSTQPRRPCPRSPSLTSREISDPSPNHRRFCQNSAVKGGPLYSSFPFTHPSSPPPLYCHNLAVMGRSLHVPLTPPMYSSPSSRAPAPPSIASHGTDGMSPSSLHMNTERMSLHVTTKRF